MGHGYLIYRAPKAGTDGLWKLADGGAKTEVWNGRDGRCSADRPSRPTVNASHFWCSDADTRNCI